jgi:hypothetical protein
VGLVTAHRKISLLRDADTDFLDKESKQRKMDMRFGAWNVRSLYRPGSLVTVSKEILKYEYNACSLSYQIISNHSTILEP